MHNFKMSNIAHLAILTIFDNLLKSADLSYLTQIKQHEKNSGFLGLFWPCIGFVYR